MITTILAVIILIVAIWEYRKRQERGELLSVPTKTHEVVIVIMILVGLFLHHNWNSWDWPGTILIFSFVLPLLGFYIFLRLIFAIIHRLER